MNGSTSDNITLAAEMHQTRRDQGASQSSGDSGNARGNTRSQGNPRQPDNARACPPHQSDNERGGEQVRGRPSLAYAMAPAYPRAVPYHHGRNYRPNANIQLPYPQPPVRPFYAVPYPMMAPQYCWGASSGIPGPPFRLHCYAAYKDAYGCPPVPWIPYTSMVHIVPAAPSMEHREPWSYPRQQGRTQTSRPGFRQAHGRGGAGNEERIGRSETLPHVAEDSVPRRPRRRSVHLSVNAGGQEAFGSAVRPQRMRPPSPAAGSESSFASENSSDSDASPSPRGRRRTKLSAPEERGPEVCNSWEWLMDPMMHNVVGRLDSNALKLMRLVCKRWRQAVDRNLEILRPLKAKIHTVIAQYPALKMVDLSACQNVRNRNLSILGRSGLRLQALYIGQATNSTYGKPRITNSAMTCIAMMTDLCRLSLCDCSAITNNGMMALASLRKLTSLAVNKCPRISDKGFAVVERFTNLEQISVYGCVKVTDGLIQILKTVTGLTGLQMGYTRITDEGVKGLAHFQKLVELRFFSEDITNAALEDLALITSLTHLSLACCGDRLTSDALLQMTLRLPLLRSLDLQNITSADDAFFTGLADANRSLQHLQVHGTAIGEPGMLALSQMGGLRSLCLDGHNNGPGPVANQQHTLLILSLITQLTSLEVQSRPLQLSLVKAIGMLRNLVHLSLSDCDATHGPTAPSDRAKVSNGGASAGLPALSTCTALTRLVLSHVSVRRVEINELVQQLPKLTDISLTDCASSSANADDLGDWANTVMPRVNVRLNNRQVPQSGSRS
eukprot:jgi/Botrbrau1/14158/Bobra.182_3s0098.1